jgi:hypothetical protein
MHRRLFVSLAGGVLGVAVATQIDSELGLAPYIVLIGAALAGLAIGYVASALFDVFSGRIGEDQANSPE